MADNFITIQEAIAFTGKSNGTIRKLVSTVVSKNANGTSFKSKDTKKIKVHYKGKKPVYMISETFLMKEFDIKKEEKKKQSDTKVVAASARSKKMENELIDTLKKQLGQKEVEIEFLKEQIKIKDDQLSKTQDLVRNEQVLMLQSKQPKIGIIARLLGTRNRVRNEG